jgi:hypothetical protein
MKTLEATIVSDCGRYKVEIERRSGGSLQVTAYRWTEEVVAGYGKVAEFWEPVPQSVTITDTLNRAKQLACEKLKLFARPDETPDQPATES